MHVGTTYTDQSIYDDANYVVSTYITENPAAIVSFGYVGISMSST